MCSPAYYYGLTPKLAIPFTGSKPYNYPTRIGAGHFRLSAKVASSSNDSGCFTSVAPSSKVSFYELLGVAETGTEEEVKKAYKKLARKYHPDVSPPGRVEEYTKRFIMVQEAYETLSDPAKRAVYDRDMANRFQFAFPARRSYHRPHGIDHQVMEQRSEWKNRWESQLSELMRKSKRKEYGCGENVSWAARVRNQKISK